MEDALSKRLLAEANAAWVAIWKPYLDSGDPEAEFQVGWFYDHFSDDEAEHRQSEYLYRAAAEQGHAAACFYVSMRHHGEERMHWLRRSAELGFPHAQHEIGARYATGDEFPKDLATARQWYRKAAEQGDAESQWDLALMLLSGEGGAADKEEGLRWLQHATLPSSQIPRIRRNAVEVLAQIYRKGHYGVTPDETQAAFWEQQLTSIPD